MYALKEMTHRTRSDYKLNLRVNAVIFFTLVNLIIGVPFYLHAQEKEKIAVIDFESRIAGDIGWEISENLRTLITQEDKYIVVERAQLMKILDEQQLQVSGFIEQEDVVKLGKLLGIKYVIMGSATKIGSIYTINVRVVDVETAKIQSAQQLSTNSLDEIPTRLQDLAANIGNSNQISNKSGAKTLSSEAQKDIEKVIYRWIETSNEKNLDEHMSFYADLIEFYFTENNVPKSKVLKDVRKLYSSSRLINVAIRNIAFQFVSDDNVAVTFDKRWDIFGGKHRFAGDEKQMLKLKKYKGEWKIYSEEELDIYWYCKRGKGKNVPVGFNCK